MDVEEVYQRGFAYRCEGRYGEAQAEFDRVLAISPRHANARWQVGLIQGFLGDFDGSLDTLAKLVRECPNHVNARYDLGMTMMMLGMQDEACAEFRAVLALDPSHENAKRQLVYC